MKHQYTDMEEDDFQSDNAPEEYEEYVEMERDMRGER